MPRRIEIELTSSRPDGTWTWRAAGAREPKGVLDGTILPEGAKAGDVIKVEAEADIDGMTIIGVVQARVKVAKVETIALITQDKPFEPVTQQLARKGRGERRERGERGERRERGERGERRERGERGERGDRSPRGEGRPNDGERRDRGPRRPRFEAPPELPQRPKAKRLRAGNTHRKSVLSEIPENQRPIAELALQGMQTVRQRLKEANAALAAEGKPTMPEQSVLQMAENLLPRLRVADWLDRAEAAKRDLAHLDLRDLRSIVAAANDAVIERSDACRELVAEMKAGLTARTEEEYQNWLSDIEANLGVGRIVRALKLAGQPPKAGAIFPVELGRRLAEAATTNLTAEALTDRWIAVLEAAAFTPIRAHVGITSKPESVPAELTKTIERLASLLPQIAAAFGIEAGTSHAPKPLRPARPAKKLPPRPPAPPTATATTVTTDGSDSTGTVPTDQTDPVAPVVAEQTSPDNDSAVPSMADGTD